MGQGSRVLPLQLDRVRGRIEDWRATRKKGTAIPTSLWMAAVELARSHGVSPVSRSLRLDYYSLKRRVESTETEDAVAGQSFVEVDMIPSTGHEGCQIELGDGEGATMIIRTSSSCDLDLRELLATFLGHSQ